MCTKQLEQWRNPLFEYDKWVYEMHDILKQLDLIHRAYNDENIINILNIPDNIIDPLLNITQKMDLVIHIKKVMIARYSGCLKAKRKLEGFQEGQITFETYKPPKGHEYDLSKPVYTIDRRM